MNIIAFIFARGGSKGVPRKNIRNFNGKPLIAWSIEQALAVQRVSKVVVSTDSLEIAEIAKKYGADVPFIRPTELSGDDSSEWLAWQHAIKFYKSIGESVDVFLSLPATSPGRSIVDINSCLDKFFFSLYNSNCHRLYLDFIRCSPKELNAFIIKLFIFFLYMFIVINFY